MYAALNVPPGIARADSDADAFQTSVVWARAMSQAPLAVAVGEESVWVVDGDRDAIRRLDPRTGRRQATIRAGAGAIAVAVGSGAVWVANQGDESVSRIDPHEHREQGDLRQRATPVALAVAPRRRLGRDHRRGGRVHRHGVRRRHVARRRGPSPAGVAAAEGSVWVTVRE